MKLKRIVIGMLVGVVGAILGMLAMAYLPASVHYRITETYQFSSPVETDVTLTVILPKDGPYQVVSRSNPKWSGTFEVQETEFVDVMTLRGKLPSGTHEASVTYKARLRQGRARWNGFVEPDHLAPHPRIESDHPDIIAKAHELGEGTTRSDIYDIFTFVASYLTHPSGDRINVRFTALDALHSGEGVCEDHSQLLVALLRAREIPSRVVSGLVFQKSMVVLPFSRGTTRQWNHPGGAHAWVELFTGNQWEMVEPTWANSDLTRRYYFGRSSGEHLSYGDHTLLEALYKQILDQFVLEGNIIGAMSAPLKFVASATSDGVSFTPMATVGKGWDGRWFNGVLVFIVTLVGVRMLIRGLMIEKK